MIKEYNFETEPIVNIVNDIIITSSNKGASDIHFDPEEDALKIRIRIDGDLTDYTIVDNKYKKNLITRIKLLAGMNITESRLPQDGAITGTIEDKDFDLRVSSMPIIYGEKIVIRILDYSMSLKGLDSLDFTKENYDKIVKMLEYPNGIVLITGATGSGKSTTVYSMLQKLNTEERNIITVEDPVEMNLAGINQVQVNPEIGLDFATILRAILRQDPNVILIGEIRDSETAKIAVRASITGHLVLSTLHTNNSLTTIERLVDMDVEQYLLSASLKGIVSQTLAKRLCPECKTKRKTTEAEKKIFKKALDLDIDEIYEANGCDHCRKGFKGRIALQEVLLINEEISNAISKGVKRDNLKKLIYKNDHNKTIFQDGLIKVLTGDTTIEEVFKLVDIDSDATNIYGNNPVEEKSNEKINETPNKNNNIKQTKEKENSIINSFENALKKESENEQLNESISDNTINILSKMNNDFQTENTKKDNPTDDLIELIDKTIL